MSEQVTEPVVVDAPAPPAAPDFGAMESIAEYRKVRESLDAEPGAEPVVEAKSEDDAADPASEAGKALAAKKSKYKERIAALVGEKHETARERDAALAEAAAIRAELAALRAGKPAAEQTVAAQPEPTPQPLTKPVRPKQSDFEDFEQYEAARETYFEQLAEFKADEKIAAEREASRTHAAIRAQHEALHQVYLRGREAFADFDAILESQANEGVRWSQALTGVILTHEHGHALAYELAKDAALARRLSSISNPIALGMEMGSLVTRLSDAQSGTSPVVAPVTSAPDPIKPVGGMSTGASTTDPSEIDSLARWRAIKKSRT